jgi:hypothetical protein
MTFLPVRATLLALLTAACAAGRPATVPAATARAIEPEPAAAPEPAGRPVHRFWAVVIGVSDYLHSDQGITDLNYADQDARAFADLLADARFGAGGIPPEQRLLLVNADATLARARSALLDFLGRAGRDDLAVVFFAGHGMPDPARPDEMCYERYLRVDPNLKGKVTLDLRWSAGGAVRAEADDFTGSEDLARCLKERLAGLTHGIREPGAARLKIVFQPGG